MKVYLDREELLHDCLPLMSVCAEIGVSTGGFSEMIVRQSVPRRLHLIDLHILPEVRSKLGPYIAGGQVITHQGRSVDVLESFPNWYFDWVYLDTTHLYDETFMELQCCDDKVCSVIAGHDIAMPGYEDKVAEHYPGVKLAVDHFCIKNGWEIVAITEVHPQTEQIDHATPNVQSYVLARKP